MTSLQEQWRDIPGAEHRYQVSDHGNVRSLDRAVPRGTDTMTIRGRAIRTPPKSNGYLHFKLSDGARSTYPTVHQCVAAAFIGPCPQGLIVNHKNGDKTDNRPANLEYVTYARNAQHAIRIGLTAIGERSVNAKLTEAQVLDIRAQRGKRTARQLAEQYRVSHLYIPLIWKRKRWAHLPE